MKRENLSMCFKRYLSILILSVFTVLLMSVNVTAADGDPDTSFGFKGLVTSTFGTTDDIGYDIVIQPDSKIVVAGESVDHNSEKDFALVRYTKSGGLDYYFGDSGKITADFGGNDAGRAVAVQPDGKIVVAGYSETDGDFALVRYTDNGDLDNTFGIGGKVTASLGNYDMCFDIAVQPDGKIVATGTSSGSNQDIAVARYNSDGTPDTGFGSDGATVTPIGTGDDSGQALILRLDGKIIVTGYSDNGSDKDFAAVQYNTDGTLDTGFGTGGKVTAPIGSGDDLCYAGAIQPDGKIVLAGYSHNGSDYDFAAVRYNSDGSPDTGFGTDGKVTARIGTGDDFAYAVTIQSDGKIVIAGKSHNGSDYDFATVRFNIDGTPDTEFGTDSRVITAIENYDGGGFGVAVQQDGNIVVAGRACKPYFSNFAVARYLSGNALPPEPVKVKITASDSTESGYFGSVVSISGDYAIVGHYEDDDNGDNSGSAYIFKKDGTSWSQQTKIIPSDGKARDNFGKSVFISGNYAIIGSPGDGFNEDCGSVYIFKRDGTSWSQQTKIIPSDGIVSDHFGYSVSISGDYAIVGAFRNDGNEKHDSGAAYICKRTGTLWSIQTKIIPGDGAVYDHFGFSVSISGDYAIVGSAGSMNIIDNRNGGSAYIFKRDETSWDQQAKIIPSDNAELDFGRSVSISGDYAIVGAYGHESPGSSYIFRRDGSIWNQQIKLIPNNWESAFGTSVSISGDYAIAGGSSIGMAHIFKREGANWNQDIILTADDVTSYFFNSPNAAISGKSVIVGFWSANPYIYTLPQTVGLYEKGDINRDSETDLTDAVIALKVTAGLNVDDIIPTGYSMSDTDVNGDNRIGMEEVLYIMKKIMFE
ncbi:MAG: hypothetical protein GY795_11180 [Desulfobacterales bacterium]|nr:hypothetical protein [Desulfobacterales bacterium]